jgi:hypothetical protein
MGQPGPGYETSATATPLQMRQISFLAPTTELILHKEPPTTPTQDPERREQEDRKKPTKPEQDPVHGPG